MTGNNENTIRDNPASYLEIAEFIQNYGANIDMDNNVLDFELAKRGVVNFTRTQNLRLFVIKQIS
ncbi:MAG: hypothetical protein IMY67_10575 [Bacteroidetes bacterium]|nr:hypothetical protein [Bacteroidota bacterium]